MPSWRQRTGRSALSCACRNRQERQSEIACLFAELRSVRFWSGSSAERLQTYPHRQHSLGRCRRCLWLQQRRIRSKHLSYSIWTRGLHNGEWLLQEAQPKRPAGKLSHAEHGIVSLETALDLQMVSAACPT